MGYSHITSVLTIHGGTTAILGVDREPSHPTPALGCFRAQIDGSLKLADADPQASNAQTIQVPMGSAALCARLSLPNVSQTLQIDADVQAKWESPARMLKRDVICVGASPHRI